MIKKLLVVGLNHKTASVAIREKIAFNNQNIGDAYEELFASKLVSEGMILSTCNRVEFYLINEENNSNEISVWLKKFFTLENIELDDCLYQYENEQAMRHIIHVASGMDSMMIGESEVLGQVKLAFEIAMQHKAKQPYLHSLFTKVFHYVKLIRTETEIGANPISVAYAAVKMAKLHFKDLQAVTAVVIGAGDTINLVCKHLHRTQISKLIVANRSLHTAEKLGKSFGGFGIQIESIREHLPKADIVISATASPLPIIGKGMIETCLEKRSQKPMVIIDIAVPRDIEHEVGNLAAVSLYSIDNIQIIVEKNKKKREAAVQEAQKFVNQFIDDFIQFLEFDLTIKPIIKEYRQKNKSVKDELLVTAIAAINSTQDKKQIINCVEKLATQLTKKLTHTPTMALQQAGEKNQIERLEIIMDSLGLANS